MKTIFCIMGKGCTGKDTVIKQMKEQNDEMEYLIPYTTREMRKNEIDGTEYHFVDDADFFKKVSSGEIIEYREYMVKDRNGGFHTCYYGTPSPKTNASIVAGTIEVYKNIIKLCGNILVVPIYIEVHNEERLYRAISRESKNESPNYKEVARRFFADERDFSDKFVKSAITPFEAFTKLSNKFGNYNSAKTSKDILEFISIFNLMYNDTQREEILKNVQLSVR